MSAPIIFTVMASIGLLLFIVELVRRRHLSEEYSLVWLFVAIIGFILSLWRDSLTALAQMVGIYDPTNFLFFVAILFVMLILLYLSTIVTRLSRENKESAQEIALLKYQLEQLRANNKNRHHQQDQ